MSDPAMIEWLLVAQTPSIRYLTLTRLLGMAEADPGVQAARQAMEATGPIPAILARQAENGAWVGEKSYYTPKYTSTHWSMLLLTELGADPEDPRMFRGAEHMLEVIEPELVQRLAQGRHGWTCLWANLLRYTLQAGLAEDPRLAIVIQALLRDGLDFSWRCPYNDERPCAWGAARALWSVAVLPAGLQTVPLEAIKQRAIDFLLVENELIRADYPSWGGGHRSELWSRLNFPLFYQTDILFVLRALADAHALDHPGAEPALDWLKGRRKPNGRWSGASPYRQRTWRALGEREETERWVTLQAANVLQLAGR